MRWMILAAPVFALALASPMAVSADGPVAHDSAPPTFQEWQVWEVRTGRVISVDELVAALSQLDVVYLGEEHHNHWHVEAALRVLRKLSSQGLRPALALEMFGWDGQAGLDRYLADKAWGRDFFLKEARWEQNWGGAFEDYEPLVAWARQQDIQVLALNPPKSLVRLVAKQGLAQAMTDSEMERWGMKGEALADEPAYHDMIVKPLRQCHGGLSDDAYRRMYEASMFRDEGMAKTIAEALQRRAAGVGFEVGRATGPIVSYTGGGHVQYRLPVPNRVVRRRGGAVGQATIYLTSFESGRADELRGLMRDGVADYLWLTPLGAQGAPKRCR
ncbi:MAG: ChaN family lipoprotein [Nitrospiraceae bacterium]